ncbi:YhdT family protein [Bacillus xiapuensis]|uniref:YhdT family protein n=1 Tax=Bacillus xiapuensis TaxID=2014075 RepID=UPI000C24EE8C|nr:YhdT family protein [Bacillus xiapuensis]
MKAIKEDKRFQVAKREAGIGILLVLINFIWWYGFAFGLGSRPVEDYTYVLGLPAWFFYSCVAGLLLMVALVWAAVKWLFRDVPFDEEGDAE